MKQLSFGTALFDFTRLMERWDHYQPHKVLAELLQVHPGSSKSQD